MPDAQSSHYDVHRAWPIRHFANADDCIEFLFHQSTRGRNNAFHGAYRADWNKILSSLDVHCERRKMDPDARFQEETKLLEWFVEDADPHLSPGARRHIELAQVKWKTYRTTGTLIVGRHHGLPTRCVDWTDNGLTALFFACRRNYDQDGVVWWMNYDNFTKALQMQWPRVYGKPGDVTDDIEEHFIDGREENVYVRLHYPDFMERARRQEAWITLSMKYGVHHDEALSQIGVGYCGRIVFKSSLKRPLLKALAHLGVTGESLGLGGGCVDLIAQDVSNGVRGEGA